MNSTLDAILQDVAEETFATLAFLMPLSEQEQAQRDSAREFAAMNLRILKEGREERILLTAGRAPVSAGEDAASSSATMTSSSQLQRFTTRVAFSGPFSGYLLLSVEEQLLEPLAANMLGMLGNSSSSQEQQHDALRELSNVICGNLLPKIGTPRDVFKVHSPEILPTGTTEANCDGLQRESRVALWLDGGRAELLLFTDREPIAAAGAASAASNLGS